MIKALVIEDDQEIRRLIAEILGYEGFSVSTAENGACGERLARQDPPDVIVCDIIMPELDGYGVLKALQTDPRTATIPFIFLTALSDPPSLRNGMRLGADDYLVKPVDPDELIAAIRTRLAKRQAAQQWRMDFPLPTIPATTTIASLTDDTQHFNGGRTIGNYRLLQVIGEGAYGIVFLCERISDGRRHAMKVLKMSVKTDKSGGAAISRFVNEANAVSQLNHPNIVNFIELGYSDNGPDSVRTPYFVMEFFPGISLARHIEDCVNWNDKQKVMVILQVACALAAVHAQNIVHGDIKPANILVDDNLNVKITDFGICHLPNSDLTSTVNILGSPCYLSPEHVATGRADHLADIYSLGVVAYELLLGARPFDAKSVTDLFREIQENSPPEPRKLKADFPPRLQDILARMLKKKPRQRYQTISELVDDLVVFEKTDGAQDALLGRLAKKLFNGKDWR